MLEAKCFSSHKDDGERERSIILYRDGKLDKVFDDTSWEGAAILALENCKGNEEVFSETIKAIAAQM